MNDIPTNVRTFPIELSGPRNRSSRLANQPIATIVMAKGKRAISPRRNVSEIL